MAPPSYEEKLQQEADLWGTVAAEKAQKDPPDWRFLKKTRHNRIIHQPIIDPFLEIIQPGMHVCELGCGSGWLTLAMAQRGATAIGYDISEQALTVAREYYAQVKTDISGTTTYKMADLNYIDLESNTFDVIAVKGTLHHLVNMPEVIAQIHQALKDGGLLWIHDTSGDEHPRSVLLASGLMFLLPTHISYGEKIRGLLKFGFASPSRIKASMEAEGLSPFEGAGRDHDWYTLVHEAFSVEKEYRAPSITGYLSTQVKVRDAIGEPLLRGVRLIDYALMRIGILQSAGVIVYARK